MPKTLTALAISQTATDFDDVSGKLLFASGDEELFSDVAVGSAAAAAVSFAGVVESGRDAPVFNGPLLLVDGEKAHREAGVR